MIASYGPRHFPCAATRLLTYVLTRLENAPCLKNVPPLTCYNFDAHEWILIFFGRNVTHKVGNQKTLYYAIVNRLLIAYFIRNISAKKYQNPLCVTQSN